MLKTSFNFRRLIDTFTPGFLVVISIWYLYKPYINKYFPTIAFDPNSNNFSSEMKLAIFIVISFFFGIIINHFSDIPISLLFPNLNSEKQKRSFKRFATTIFGIFSWSNHQDPRIYSIKRYLSSNRKEIFLSLLNDWSYSNKNLIENNDNEIIIAHQHICTRLRALKPHSNDIYNASIGEVYFSSSLFSSVFIIFLLSIFALILNNIFNVNDFNLKFISNWTLGFIIFFEYVLLLILSYSLKRRFTHFASQIITIALHFYAEKTKKNKK